MKNKHLLTIICIMFSLVVSCDRSSSPSAQQTVTLDLQQEWFPFAGFAGEISGAKRFAAHNNLKLNIRPGSEQVDPIKLVLSKTCPVGVVGGDLLVAAVAKGAPLVAIAVVNGRSPTIFLVNDNSPIKSPKDFPGHKVGVLAGTNTERIYELMMKRLGINRNTVQEIQVPFDLQTFMLGSYDVRPAFIYDEPVSLEQQGKAFRMIKPEDFGVNFIGTVYFTTREYLASHRIEVMRLLTTLNEGWKFALTSPDESIKDLVEAFPNLKPAREKRALELGKPYFADERGQPLVCNPENWHKMIKGLEELKVIPQDKVAVADVWDPSPLKEAISHE